VAGPPAQSCAQYLPTRPHQEPLSSKQCCKVTWRAATLNQPKETAATQDLGRVVRRSNSGSHCGKLCFQPTPNLTFLVAHPLHLDDGHCLSKVAPSDLASFCACLNALLCPPPKASKGTCQEALIHVGCPGPQTASSPGTRGVIQLYDLQGVNHHWGLS